MPTVTCVIDGKVIVDCQNISSTTVGADQNGADVLHDYLLDGVYGKGLALGDLNSQSFVDAKTYLANSSRPKLNGVLSTQDSLIDNVEKILSACNGMLVYHNGQYKLKIKGNEGSATRTFDTSNIPVSYTHLTLPTTD